MVANIRGFTPNYDFKLINFDTPRWHTLEYSNWTLLDALLTQAGLSHVKGEWTNATAYIEGERVIDVDDNLIYRCQEGHLSAATGSFAEDRLLHPTYWAHLIEAVPIYRGAWSSGVAYDSGDIVHYTPYTYYLCATAHTSTAAFDPAMWVVIFDATAVVTAAAASEANAAASAAAADISEANAAASATAADISADAAQVSADAAHVSADNALSAQGAFKWNLINDATVSDPGTGNQKYNNANLALATKLSISGKSADGGNPNVQQWLMTWDDSTSIPVKGTIYVRKLGFPDNFFIFNIIGTAVDHTTWVEFDVTFLSQNGLVLAGEQTTVGFARTGNTGGTGSGTGDMLRSANLSDVANIGTSRNNLGVGAGQVVTFNQVLLADPTQPQHAVTQGYLESGTSAALAGKVNKAGDTMTGALAINPTGAAPFPGAFLEVSDSLMGSLSYSPTWAWFEETVFDNAATATHCLARSKGTMSTPAPVTQGTMIGTTFYNANDGGDWASGAAINAFVDGPVVVGAVPMSLQFCTGSVDGGVDRLRIDSSGKSTFTQAHLGGSVQTITEVTDGDARRTIGVETKGLLYGEAYLYTGSVNYGYWDYISQAFGTKAAPAAITQGTEPWGIAISGHDGTTFRPSSASVCAVVDGPVSAGHVPLAFSFKTGDSSGAGGVERLRIDSVGNTIAQKLISNGDVYAGFSGAGGTYRFGNGSASIQYDGANYTVNGGGWYVRSPELVVGYAGTTGTLRFGNTGTKYLTYDGTQFTLSGGSLTVQGRVTATADMMTLRPGNAPEGLIYFGNSAAAYIHYNGTFNFTHVIQAPAANINGALNVAGVTTTNSTFNINQYPAWLYQGGQMPMMIQSATGYTAGLSFHNAGSFAVNFGLGSDNVLRVGGWSYGATWYKLWTAYDVGDVVINTRLVYVGDVDHGNQSGLQEPWGNAAVTGMTGLSAYYAWVARYRLLQVHATAGYYNSELG
jgi:hypothetical protein